MIATGYPLSHGFQPCQLSHRESQGAGVARRLQGVSRREYGGAAALGSPFGGAGERSETERAQAVASLHIGAVIAAGYPLSHGFQPCQLSHRESQGAGVARPAQRNHPGKNSPVSRKNPPAWDWRTGFLSNWLLPLGQHRTIVPASLSRLFAPLLQFEKWEI